MTLAEKVWTEKYAQMSHGRTRYWEAGTGTPTIPGYMAAKPGHDFIREAGVANIRKHNVRLTDSIAQKALDRGLTVNTPLEAERRTGDAPGQLVELGAAK